MLHRIWLGVPLFMALMLGGCVIRVQGAAQGKAQAQGASATKNSATPVRTCPDLDPNTTVTYDFNALSEGKLDGQDGWTLVHGNSPMQLARGKGFDGSMAAVFMNYGQIVRKNSGAFSVPKISGNETTLAIEYDTLFAGYIVGGTSEFMLVSAATMTGDLASTSTSPWIGVKEGHLNYRQSSFGEQIPAPVPSDVKPGHWIRLRLVIDLTDKREGKNGSATVFLKNLTKEDKVFRSIPRLDNLDAHLERASTPPATWDAMYVRFDKPADYRIDNLRVSPAANCR
ncbi:MAG TPA: hypothetical protein PK156_37920 [Polyangium sp.]|nr:hypothetical protein [Polyangium sp.]